MKIAVSVFVLLIANPSAMMMRWDDQMRDIDSNKKQMTVTANVSCTRKHLKCFLLLQR